ncbi:hypothetical protein EDC96DRAFT_190150 [Choanephora cucurbitarum]|nr:hypothetical protein EDC96DRAFT_190150 [Choanephora cucurbitarum]
MSNTNIPEEYLHCFNVTDEFGEVEPMELESSQVPDVAEVVGYEWHQWQPGQEEPAQTVEEQLGIKSLIRFRDFKQWKVEEYITLKEEEKVEVAVPSQQNNSKSKTAVNKVRGSYRSYSPQQIQELIDLVIMTGMSARQAGLSLGNCSANSATLR